MRVLAITSWGGACGIAPEGTTPMRVLAITSVGGACGIWNYAEMLQDALRTAAPDIELLPSAEALDPDHPEVRSLIHDARSSGISTVWLNFHAGLHSRWTPDRVQELKESYRVVITYHDTYGEAPPTPAVQALHDVADAFVVHEPCEGLERQVLIRQGVPGWQVPAEDSRWCAGQRPLLGTCGFNFGWKSFDQLAEVTAACGWAYLVLSNNATDVDEARWRASNPYTLVVRGFRPTSTIVSYLAGCDATCFAYQCANSGTSGAIRLGLAARKPVIAFQDCRQFRDLCVYASGPTREYYYNNCVAWCSGFEGLPGVLASLSIQRVDPGIVAIAERDSWVRHAARYAEIFRSLDRGDF